MSQTTPLARAKGHGSAQSGVRHWLAQRLSAVFLLFLSGWMIYAIFALAGADYEAVRAFVARPLNAALFVLLLIAMLYHAMLGLQVVIEDYVHQRAAEIALHFVVRAGAFLGMALGVINVLQIALGD